MRTTIIISLLFLASTPCNSQTTYIFCNSILAASTEIKNGKILYKETPKSLRTKSLFTIDKKTIYYKTDGSDGAYYHIDKEDKPTVDGKHHYYYISYTDGEKYIFDLKIESKSILLQSDHAQMIFSIESYNTIR